MATIAKRASRMMMQQMLQGMIESRQLLPNQLAIMGYKMDPKYTEYLEAQEKLYDPNLKNKDYKALSAQLETMRAQLPDEVFSKMSDEEYYETLSGLEKQQYDIQKLALERQEAAYKGELPVSPALERELADEERVMREALSQKLGPNYETSTPGIQSLSEMRERHSALREAARRGEIESGSQILLGQMGYADTKATKKTSDIFGVSGKPMLSGWNAATQPYLTQRGQDIQKTLGLLNYKMNRGKNSTGLDLGGVMSGLGSMGGAAAMLLAL